MRETKAVSDATRDHERILKALRARKLESACAALEENLRRGKAPILAWLRGRETARHGGGR
jgi:DNA-binding GntR family transcriptional regulator